MVRAQQWVLPSLSGDTGSKTQQNINEGGHLLETEEMETLQDECKTAVWFSCEKGMA